MKELKKPSILTPNRKKRREIATLDMDALIKHEDKLIRKSLKRLESLLGVRIEDPEFSQKFLETQCVKVSGNYLVHKDVYQEWLRVEELKLPCGYIWMDTDDLRFEYIPLKNGQASTGSVKKRVTSFKTRGLQLLLDIVVDDVFKKDKYDQFLNDAIESDYYADYKIEVIKENRRTKEDLNVPRSLLFDFPQLKRNTLSRLLNKSLTKKNFYASVSHEECLRKLTTNSNQQFFLLDCVMRFGKSFIFFEYIKRNWVDIGRFGIHTVFCHDTKTVAGWISKADIYYTGMFDCIILKDNKSFDFNQEVKKNTVVFISQQLLHSNKDTSNPDEVYTQPLHKLIKLDINCDNTFVDEVHQYFSPKWKSYFESITKGRIVLASGTAAKIKLSYPDLFDEYNTHTDTLKDLKDRLFAEYGIEIYTVINRINISKLGSEFTNISNLQDIDEHGNLVNPALGYKFCDSIFKGYRTSPMSLEKISTSNPVHCPIYVDTIEFAKLIFEYLTNNPELNIVPILVAGAQKTVKDETELKKFIKKQNSDGKSTAMITCGSMIQGISVEEWKDLMNISVVGTYEMFYQFFGRGWEIDVIAMKDKKVTITMWDYNPHRTLKAAAQFVQSLAMTNGLDIPKAFEYYFQIHHIFDYVSERNSFVEVSTSVIEEEIRQFVDSQVLNRGCKARLVTNTRPEVMGDISDELLEIFLNTQGLKPNSNIVKELKSYKTDINKQKTNHSKKSHHLEIPKIPKNIQDVWQSVIDGLSVYTERIPIVTEVMFNEGKLETKNVTELMSKSQDGSFIGGFGFPNSKISKQFSDYILRHGDLQKINLKVDNSKNIIPRALECLDMNIDEFLKVGDSFDEIYKYAGDDTQLSVRDSYNILKKELKGVGLKVGQRIVVQYAKSGSINLALTYLLKENSKKIFGRELTNQEIIESVSYEDENTFFESLINTMGFSKTTHAKKDFIIINPPYKSGLHIEIFNKAFEELNDGGTLICLHPSTPFINRKPTKDDGKTQKIKEIVSKYKTRLTLVDGNKIFDAGFFTPLSITRVEKVLDEKIEVVYSHIDSTNKEVKVYDKLDDIFIHGNDIVIGIYNKIIPNIKKSLEDMLYRKNNISQKYIRLARISGHPPKPGEEMINPDFFQLIYKANEKDLDSIITDSPIGKRDDGNQFNELVIKDTDKVEYIHSYLMGKFSRFCLSLYKNSANILSDLGAVPYMDFSQEWTDEKLFDYFELTQEEREFINTYIPNWYERDFN